MACQSIPMRDKIFETACKRFPHHTHILSHYGKFLSEKERKYLLADEYLLEANRLEPANEAIMHILGKRYLDEIRDLLQQNPPRTRDPGVQAN